MSYFYARLIPALFGILVLAGCDGRIEVREAPPEPDGDPGKPIWENTKEEELEARIALLEGQVGELLDRSQKEEVRQEMEARGLEVQELSDE